MSLLRDFRGQVSWGRFCALVALIVAVAGQFSGMNIEAVKVWLSVAVGNYGASKLTEILAGLKGMSPAGTSSRSPVPAGGDSVGVAAPSAPSGGPVPGNGSNAAGGTP